MSACSSRHPWNGVRPSTSRQHQAIRSLLHALELPTDVITLMHRIPFGRAGIPQPRQGMQLDTALGDLTRVQASRLIDVLRDDQEAVT